MAAGFVYRPHVAEADGAVVTPDILVDRVLVAESGGLAAAPVSRLASATVLQRPPGAAPGRPACVLVAAGFGALAAAGAVFDDVLPVGRAAWRWSGSLGGLGIRAAVFAGGAPAERIAGRLVVLAPSARSAAGALAPGTALFLPCGPLRTERPADRMEVSLEQAGGGLLSHAFALAAAEAPDERRPGGAGA